ncbi:MAG: hypothetical protein NXY57DRAFT_1104469 [Lentinula lateritia]|nr:MAG: hypothetical protein NXY57DRAFT_1104469 [Lentinula lateritia]
MNSSVIQSHLYNSFLSGQTSDVSIRISGAFSTTYRLHRVVLIQAGFWRDLFTGGFVESSVKLRTTGRKSDTRVASSITNSSSGEEILDVVLDDRNISRAAFELSISRLYGGGPPLYIHPSLVPMSTHPLTSGFPYPSVLPASSLLPYAPGCQPATPEFLISLLATSLYLSIPSLASEALTWILRTIGPRTVGYYLDFALGMTKLKNADHPAVGLEGLAKDLEEGEHGLEYSDLDMSTSFPVENRSGQPSETYHERYSPLIVDSPSSPNSLRSTSDEYLSLPFSQVARNRNYLSRSKVDITVPSTQFYYGSISDKIGETCACWLARWGADMFVEEEKIVSDWLNDPNASLDSWTVEESGFEGVPLTSDTDSHRPSHSTSSAWTPKWSQSNVKSIPKFFTATAVGSGFEGLSLSWIHALISSDSFFVPAPSLYDSLSITPSISAQSTFDTSSSRNPLPATTPGSPEEERYAFAKGVVELRRAVRTKVRQLRKKQMEIDEENERHAQQSRFKGKGRQLTPLDYNDEDYQDGLSDHSDTAISDEWKQWSDTWQNECSNEDKQWDAFFSTGIYYTNMSTEAVIDISRDISPSTGRPYVDLRTLQQAVWEAELVKHTIIRGNQNTSSHKALYPVDKLGFAKPVSSISSTSTTDNSLNRVKLYFTIPANESLRIGDTITTFSGINVEGNIHNNITMDELFASSFGKSSLHREHSSRERKGMQRGSATLGDTAAASSDNQTGEQLEQEKTAPIAKTSTERTFFGLRDTICYAAHADDHLFSFISSPAPFLHHSPSPFQLPPSQLLSTHPPLRFSVEFFNLEMLKEKDRIHSRTVWYAGSLWNVYVQVVQRKDKNSANVLELPKDVQTYRSPGSGLLPNYQLGVYLHRQSPTENTPPFSAPDPFSDSRQSIKDHYNPSLSSPSSTYSPTSPNSPVTSSTLQVPRSQQILISSPSSPSPRGPAFAPLTPYASAPQATSSSASASQTSSSTSRLRGNSGSSLVSPSLHPMTAPVSPSSSSARPRTPGGSGGWRNLAPSHSANSLLSGNNFLSSSLPTVFPTFGRSRHQGSGSRDGTTRNMDYGIPGASASTSQVGRSTPSPLSSTPIPSGPSAITVAPPASTTSSTDLPFPDPPFYAVANSKSIYPYTDPRQVVSVYFSVNCASPTGSAQTRFRSAPDIFKVGQSWGWKSSGLLGGLQGSAGTKVNHNDGGLEAALIQMDRELPAAGHEVSLRATVVLGIV